MTLTASLILFRPEKDTPENTLYNRFVSGVRICSEHCIGFLKGRWSSLRCLPVCIDNSEGLRYATLWVSACVYLHAFAMNHEDGRFYSQDQFYKDGQAYVKEQRINE